MSDPTGVATSEQTRPWRVVLYAPLGSAVIDRYPTEEEARQGMASVAATLKALGHDVHGTRAYCYYTWPPDADDDTPPTRLEIEAARA